MTESFEASLRLSHAPDTSTRLQAVLQLSEHVSDSSVVTRLGEMLHDLNIAVQVDAAEVLMKLCGYRGLELVLDELVRRVTDPDTDYIRFMVGEVKATTRRSLFEDAVRIADDRDSQHLRSVVASLIEEFNSMQDQPRNRVNPDGTQGLPS